MEEAATGWGAEAVGTQGIEEDVCLPPAEGSSHPTPSSHRHAFCVRGSVFLPMQLLSANVGKCLYRAARQRQQRCVCAVGNGKACAARHGKTCLRANTMPWESSFHVRAWSFAQRSHGNVPEEEKESQFCLMSVVVNNARKLAAQLRATRVQRGMPVPPSPACARARAPSSAKRKVPSQKRHASLFKDFSARVYRNHRAAGSYRYARKSR